ncbi:hypothetical protein TNCV_1644621 [Trichonephila clavipes]|nr:hypothetical protein TNCV_1644621 [Trichonephila clavipes]
MASPSVSISTIKAWTGGEGNILQHPAPVVSAAPANKSFGPPDLTSMCSVCTRKSRRQTCYIHGLNGSYNHITIIKKTSLPSSRNGIVCKTTSTQEQFNDVYRSVNCQFDDRSAFNGVMNKEPERSNGAQRLLLRRIHAHHDGHIQVWRHCGKCTLPTCIRHHHTGPSLRAGVSNMRPACRMWHAST